MRNVCIDSEPSLQRYFEKETSCGRDAGVTADAPQ